MKYISYIVLMLSLIGCSEKNKFESEFSKPEWFASIEVPRVDTYDQVDALWQSEKRCCEDPNIVLKNARIFYKSCFNAITEHYEDEELVVLCLNLMDEGVGSKNRIQTTKFLVDNFSHHKNSIIGCANCLPGDTVARQTLRLAMHEGRLKNPKGESIKLLENVLDNRGDEISYWVQAEIYEYLGKLYIQTEIDDDRLGRMKEVYERFNRIKKINAPLERRYATFDKVYREIIEMAPNQN